MFFMEKFNYIKNLLLLKIIKRFLISIILVALAIPVLNWNLWLENYNVQKDKIEISLDKNTKKNIIIDGKQMIFKNGNVELINQNELNNLIKNNIDNEYGIVSSEIFFFNLKKFLVFNYIVLLYMMIGMSILIFVYMMRNFKYEMLPFRFQMFETIADNKIYKIYNVLHQKKDKNLIYKSKSAPNYEEWEKQKDNIKQFLGWQSLEIRRYKNLFIKLSESNLTQFFKFDMKKLKKGFIFFGRRKSGDGEEDYYLELKKLTHVIIGAESGSGKSVFVQNFLMNLFFNIENISKVFLIDYKKMEFENYKQYESENLEVCDDFRDSLKKVEEVKNIMYERIADKSNIKNGEYQGKFIFLIIDEANTIKNRMGGKDEESKIAKEIEKILIDINQKGRSARIRMFLITQELSTEGVSSSLINNMQSRMNLKTQTPNNVQKAIGTDKVLTDAFGITKEDFRSFPKGRAVFRDGDNGTINMFQTPFIEIDSDEIRNFVDRQLTRNNKKDEIIEEAKNDYIETKSNKEDEKMKDAHLMEYDKLRRKLYTHTNLLKSGIDIKKEEKSQIMENLRIINAEIKENKYNKKYHEWMLFIVKKWNL